MLVAGPRRPRRFAQSDPLGKNRRMQDVPHGDTPPFGHGLDGVEWPDVLRSSAHPGRRVFVDECGHMVKVQVPALDPSAPLRNNDLLGEARILRLIEGVPGVPGVAFSINGADWQALGTEYVARARSQLTAERSVTRVRIGVQMARICVRLARRGISHNDIKLGNVLIDPAGKVWLVDFDQATTGHSQVSALVLNLVGSHFVKDKVTVHGSLRTLLRSLSRRRMLARQRRMPRRPVDGSPAAQLMWDAWTLGQKSDANAPGDGVAYYALEFEGMSLPGERAWEDRWQVLSAITPYTGRKVLELGCNMGLLSCYLQKYAGAGDVMGVDHDARIVESAQKVAQALDVQATFSVADLNDPDTVDRLKAFGADVVTCLNVWNWVDRHDLLADLLACAPVVLFEGHDPEQVEIDRLRGMGFVTVEVVSTSERGRPIILATKESSADDRTTRA